MTEIIEAEVKNAIRTLYKSDENVRRVFDWTASRERDASETSIERIALKANLARGDALSAAKRMAEASCGRLIVGRHGQRTRFEWWYSRIALGQIAAGEDVELEKSVDPIVDLEVDMPDEREGITIPEAKRLLAATLGIEESQIEISIRA